MNFCFRTGRFIKISQVVWESYLIFVYVPGVGFIKVLNELYAHLRTWRYFGVSAHFDHLQ
jgi:GTP-binding protein EngB required for normal cell division